MARRRRLARQLLALPLLIGAVLHVVVVIVAFLTTQPGRDPVNVAIFLVPGLLYGFAAALLLGDRGRRLAWFVLFLSGAALTAVHLAYVLQYHDAGPALLFPPYLTVVAMFELERLRRRSPCDGTVQL